MSRGAGLIAPFQQSMPDNNVRRPPRKIFFFAAASPRSGVSQDAHPLARARAMRAEIPRLPVARAPATVAKHAGGYANSGASLAARSASSSRV